MLWYWRVHLSNGKVTSVHDSMTGGLLVFDSYADAERALRCTYPNPMERERYEIYRITDYPNYNFASKR